MTYIEGFVIPVPTVNKQKFVDHARTIDAMFIEHGATRVVECWQDKVEKGHTTDFFGAVACTEDEAVAFSWVEWTDKAARQRGMGEIEMLMSTDPRLDPAKNPMPFDGKRMVFGSFAALVEEGAVTPGAYVQGFLVPVPAENKAAYRTAALAMWEIMKDYGAVRVIEAWQDDVAHGKQTDFFRAVKAEDGEIVVFSFVEWTSREVCESAHDNMMQDERMKTFMGANPDAKPPFDGKRMVWGGFVPVVDLTRETSGARS
jgi:uncharacterized protein YbaA (DUF1428 family)